MNEYNTIARKKRRHIGSFGNYPKLSSNIASPSRENDRIYRKYGSHRCDIDIKGFTVDLSVAVVYSMNIPSRPSDDI